MLTKNSIICLSLCIATLLLMLLNMLFGSINIPADQVLKALIGEPTEKASWGYIVVESRLPQTITAVLCGASLAVSGLLLQTSFRNPLAGPSILGITNGASLGVALVMLVGGGVIGDCLASLSDADSAVAIGGFLAVIISAFIGSMLVILLLLGFASVIRNNLTLLIIGIMVSYLTSSIVSLLYYFANADNVQGYVMWGMGSFSNVSLEQLPWFIVVSIVGIVISVMLIKSLNALLLGDNYAINLGFNIRRTRRLLLLSTGILTAITTAFCGPVAFIGLAVPHIARLLIGTSNHKYLLPATLLCGSVIALLCNLICILPENMIIPLNAVTPVFGAPVIIWCLLRKR